MTIGEYPIEKKIEPSPKLFRWFFFLAGIIATIAYRIIFLLSPYWIEVAWYIGTVGFILYFGHRTIVETKRANLVKEYDLMGAVEQSDIHGDKKKALLYLIKTSLTSKARYNSFFIFILSFIVLILNLAMDLYYLL